jgi:hypothetical protein
MCVCNHAILYLKTPTGVGVVFHNCNPSYLGDGPRRIMVGVYLGKIMRSYLKNKIKKKRTWGYGSGGRDCQKKK